MSAAPEWVRVARVVKPHGVFGEVCLEMLGGGPDRLPPGTEVRCGERLLRVTSVRGAGDRVLSGLAEISDKDAAAAISGRYLEVRTEHLRPLPEGEYFHFQLVGLQVCDETGQEVGEVVDVEPYPANDVYVLRTTAGELRLPAVRSAVLGIDLGAGTMIVDRKYLEGWVDAV